MNKELNIIEASNMPIGTEFNVICVNGIKICNKVHFNEYGELCDTEDWKIQINSLLLNATFISMQEPSSFMEAIVSGRLFRIDISHLHLNNIDNKREFMDTYRYAYFTSEDLLKELSDSFTSEDINNILSNAKFYIVGDLNEK